MHEVKKQAFDLYFLIQIYVKQHWNYLKLIFMARRKHYKKFKLYKEMKST